MSQKLNPCPFCGGEARFERMGTARQSCIVECGNCGARHESSDEYERSGTSWNERHAASPAVHGDDARDAARYRLACKESIIDAGDEAALDRTLAAMSASKEGNGNG